MQDSENGRRNAHNLAAFAFAGLVSLRPSGGVDTEDRANESLAYISFSAITVESVHSTGIGKEAIFPGGGWDQQRNYIGPLQAPNGSVALTATGADQTISEAPGAGTHAYLTSISAICTVAGAAGACTLTLLDGPGGTPLWRLNLAAKPAANQEFKRVFEMPPRSRSSNGVFAMSTTGTDTTWDITVNGYKSSIMGTRRTLT